MVDAARWLTFTADEERWGRRTAAGAVASNAAMVDLLARSGALRSPGCVAAFKAVDRRHFWTTGSGDLAYADMPLRAGRLHISAPHIYAKALESLMPLEPGMSFLNVGSGTGYFNSVVAELTGAMSTNHGIDICEETVQHAAHRCGMVEKVHIEFTTGNVYQLDVNATMRYDRIYLGACANSRSKYLYRLLEVGGLLIGPFQSGHSQQLRRVVRRTETQFNVEVLGSVQFASLIEPAPLAPPQVTAPSVLAGRLPPPVPPVPPVPREAASAAVGWAAAARAAAAAVAWAAAAVPPLVPPVPREAAGAAVGWAAAAVPPGSWAAAPPVPREAAVPPPVHAGRGASAPRWRAGGARGARGGALFAPAARGVAPAPPATAQEEATLGRPGGGANASAQGVSGRGSSVAERAALADAAGGSGGLPGVAFTFALRERPWTRERSWLYPASFRRTVRMGLLCRPLNPGLPSLPPEVWVSYILPWCRKSWFEPVQDVEEMEEGDGRPELALPLAAAGAGAAQAGPSRPSPEMEGLSRQASLRPVRSRRHALIEVFDNGIRHTIGARGDPDDVDVVMHQVDSRLAVPLRVLQLLARDARRPRQDVDEDIGHAEDDEEGEDDYGVEDAYDEAMGAQEHDEYGEDLEEAARQHRDTPMPYADRAFDDGYGAADAMDEDSENWDDAL